MIEENNFLLRETINYRLMNQEFDGPVITDIAWAKEGGIHIQTAYDDTRKIVECRLVKKNLSYEARMGRFRAGCDLRIFPAHTKAMDDASPTPKTKLTHIESSTSNSGKSHFVSKSHFLIGLFEDMERKGEPPRLSIRYKTLHVALRMQANGCFTQTISNTLHDNHRKRLELVREFNKHGELIAERSSQLDPRMIEGLKIS